MLPMKAMWVVVFLILSIDSVIRSILVAIRVVARKREPAPGLDLAGAVILIAGRDESGTIGPTVRALLPALAEWPRSTLIVVADNCVDATAEEAKAAGATVFARTGGRVGKGAVIDWWMSRYPEQWKSRDAVVILDADSRLEPGGLRALRGAIAAGAPVAQAFVAPDASGTPGRLAGYSEVLMQRIDDEARRRCGWPVPLRGTGMVFRTKILVEIAPRLHTLAEDLEMDVLLLSRGLNVVFVPGAVVRDPKPREARGVSNQRARWFQGQLQVLRDYPREIIHSLNAWRLGTWMLLPMLFLRPKVLLIALRLMAILVGILLGAPWWIVASALLADGLYYLGGAAVVDSPRRYLLDLFSAPRYVMLWLYSLGVAVIRRGGWLRAGR